MSQWYLYVNEEVTGPFDPSDLQNELEEDTLVCRAGEEEWQKAGTVPELNELLTPDTQPEPTETTTTGTQESETNEEELDQVTDEETIIEPTLENFLDICEQASDQNLLNEYENNLSEYDSQERTILIDELKRRDIFQKT
jgi:hypothetical protein